jgi:hypothetical protein
MVDILALRADSAAVVASEFLITWEMSPQFPQHPAFTGRPEFGKDNGTVAQADKLGAPDI